MTYRHRSVTLKRVLYYLHKSLHITWILFFQAELATTRDSGQVILESVYSLTHAHEPDTPQVRDLLVKAHPPDASVASVVARLTEVHGAITHVQQSSFNFSLKLLKVHIAAIFIGHSGINIFPNILQNDKNCYIFKS